MITAREYLEMTPSERNAARARMSREEIRALLEDFDRHAKKQAQVAKYRAIEWASRRDMGAS